MKTSNEKMSAELVLDNFVFNVAKGIRSTAQFNALTLEQIRVIVGLPTLTETQAREQAIEAGKSEPEAIKEANQAREKLFSKSRAVETIQLSETLIETFATKYRESFKEVESETANQYASHIKALLKADCDGYRDTLIQALEGKRSVQTAYRELKKLIKQVDGNTGATGSTSEASEPSDEVGHSTDLERGQLSETSEGFDCTDKRISDADFIAMKIFVKACGNDAFLALQIAERLQKHACEILVNANTEESIKAVGDFLERTQIVEVDTADKKVA